MSDDRMLALAKGLNAWDRKWPDNTILPATMQRQCEAELGVLCALAATIVQDAVNAEGRSDG